MEKLYTVRKTRPGADCGLDHELLIAKFRLKLKKVGKTTRPFSYDLNKIPYDYTVEVTNRLKGLDLIDGVPEELWNEVHDIVQETAIKTIPMEKKCKKAKWWFEEAVKAKERREVKGKGEKERYVCCVKKVTLCDCMGCSSPGFPVHCQLPEFILTHVHESVMPSNHFILCHPLFLLPSLFPSIRVFSSESVLCIRWPKYWSFSSSISPSNEYSRNIEKTPKNLLQHNSSKSSIFIYGPILTSIHDYWKNYSFD